MPQHSLTLRIAAFFIVVTTKRSFNGTLDKSLQIIAFIYLLYIFIIMFRTITSEA